MRYATWKLNYTDSLYGIGPEDSIIAQGGSAEGCISDAAVELGGTILGYFTGQPTDLDNWQFQEITQQEALAFAQSVNNSAIINSDGKIVISDSE
jgi:fructose-1,6-bisphosphatase/sedoheptulose 1,7-bisphosphatase-like protein